MVLPIVAYGEPVLRQPATDITPDYPGLQALIADMFETMDNAAGVGLAAPQIGKSIRLFVVDTTPMYDEQDPEAELKGYRKVFINPRITSRAGPEWVFNEGCLSIPGIREDVTRPEEITITYRDAGFAEHTETLGGLRARVIQHEYDHIEGILFTDHLSPLKKQFLRAKLAGISKGKTKADYPMHFPRAKARK